MERLDLAREFLTLTTPLIADACLRLKIAVRAAPAGTRPLLPHHRLAGRVLPARHHGSVDVFLEAMESAEPGDVLVIDNQGRADEACIGDLTALEARAAGLAGIVVWGLHRDTSELIEMDYPIFSSGAYAVGPQRLDPRQADDLTRIGFGAVQLGRDNAVFADADGVLFAPLDRVEALLTAASAIRQTERRQADAVKAGRSLREQFDFTEYLKRHAKDPAYTFRRHLRGIGGAIEE
jgi:regulator of RNase E activity RraA